MDIRQIYARESFSRLCVCAGVKDDFSEPAEEDLRKAFSRFATIDSRRLLMFALNILPQLGNIDFTVLPAMERRMMQMLYATIWGTGVEDWKEEIVRKRIRSLSDSPVMLRELMDLLQYKYDQIDFIDEPVELGFACPLDLHCTYTRDQLLVAMDYLNPGNIREGVKYLLEKKADVLFVTLYKSDKDYSPSTMYRDYSISDTLFHWQSQSTTSETSVTGRRYIHHQETGNRILLFVREFKTDRITGGAAAYTFLGTAKYVSHQGSRPMSITWRLDAPIPARFLKMTNKLMVG